MHNFFSKEQGKYCCWNLMSMWLNDWLIAVSSIFQLYSPPEQVYKQYNMFCKTLLLDEHMDGYFDCHKEKGEMSNKFQKFCLPTCHKQPLLQVVFYVQGVSFSINKTLICLPIDKVVYLIRTPQPFEAHFREVVPISGETRSYFFVEVPALYKVMIHPSVTKK